MSAFYGKTNADDEHIAVIHKAAELGCTFLDTSDMYGPFTNEELVGKALKGRHNDYTVATKFGITVGASGFGYNGKPEHVRSACEASLKRLGIDCIDLYYYHRVDPATPIEDTMHELKKLVEEGKIKYVGLSEATLEQTRRAHAVHPITAYQMEWSLWSRDVEKELVPLCRELGIGIVAYSPLGRGFLTGAIKSHDDLAPDDWRRTQPRFQPEAMQKNLEAVQKVEELAQQKGCTPGQLALAWVFHQGEDVFPIPGTRRIKYLEENVAAFGVKLTPEDIKTLEAAVETSQIIGTRYDEQTMSMVYDGDAHKTAA
jgi:aryl-alcohol dehydrogenase-like predicted oxidoreductase